MSFCEGPSGPLGVTIFDFFRTFFYVGAFFFSLAFLDFGTLQGRGVEEKKNSLSL